MVETLEVSKQIQIVLELGVFSIFLSEISVVEIWVSSIAVSYWVSTICVSRNWALRYWIANSSFSLYVCSPFRFKWPDTSLAHFYWWAVLFAFRGPDTFSANPSHPLWHQIPQSPTEEGGDPIPIQDIPHNPILAYGEKEAQRPHFKEIIRAPQYVKIAELISLPTTTLTLQEDSYFLNLIMFNLIMANLMTFTIVHPMQLFLFNQHHLLLQAIIWSTTIIIIVSCLVYRHQYLPRGFKGPSISPRAVGFGEVKVKEKWWTLKNMPSNAPYKAEIGSWSLQSIVLHVSSGIRLLILLIPSWTALTIKFVDRITSN